MADRKLLPGKFVWFELVARDAKKAQAFHGEVLGWKVQPFPMGDSTYEMIYAASGATRVIPPTRWRPAVAGAGMSCTPAIRRKRSRSTRRSSGSRTALWSGRTSRTTSSRRAASTAAE